MQFQSNSYLFLCGNWQADSNIYLEKQKAKESQNSHAEEKQSWQMQALSNENFL